MLILISGGYRKDNPEIYNLLTEKKRKIAYIPAWFGSESKRDFNRFKKQFKPSDVKCIDVFLLDQMSSAENLMSYDVIYFDGGNTFFTLHHLKRLKLIAKLRKFAKNKILVGMSAGSLIQTPNVNLASIPRFDKDDKIYPGSKKSLGLIPFEVFPHFENDEATLKSLKKYSKKHSRKIYLLPDGSSIVKRTSLKFFGPYQVLYKGKVL